MIVASCLAAILLPAGPPPAAAMPGLIDALGSSTCAARERAMRDLLGCVSGTLDGRLGLRRGIESRDPEIRWRTLWVLRKLYPCPACYGAGWTVPSYWDGRATRCDGCGGVGVEPEAWRAVMGNPRTGVN